MCDRASSPRTSPVTRPRTSAKRYGFDASQIVTVTLGSATTSLYLARCTSVLMRTCSSSASTHITWVRGSPLRFSVVSAAKFLAVAREWTAASSIPANLPRAVSEPAGHLHGPAPVAAPEQDRVQQQRMQLVQGLALRPARGQGRHLLVGGEEAVGEAAEEGQH